MTGAFVRSLIALVFGANACANISEPPQTIDRSGEKAIAFTHDAISFSGSLWIPRGTPPFPAVVIIGGNGLWRPARPYFDLIRDSFLSRGIAVAYYDRRGEGGSGGDFDRAEYADLAGDAVSAVNAVRVIPEIDPAMTGVWGHSMGGWIGPLAASQSSSIAFVITAAGPGVGPVEQTLYARENDDRAAGISEDRVLALSKLRRVIVEYYVYRTSDRQASAQAALDAARAQDWYSVAAQWPELQGVVSKLPSPAVLAGLDRDNPDLLRWFRRDGLYDPGVAMARLRIPCLALFGEADRTVPLDESISALLSGYGDKSRLTIRRYPGADHMITVNGSLAPGYLGDMGSWIDGLRTGPVH